MKCLVLLSGGLDSSTALALAVKEYKRENVVALSISYGQKHVKEIEASNAIAKYYNVCHISLDLEKIFSYTLTEGDVKNQSVPGVPAYSKDFSNGYMSFNLNGDGANRILITMKSKIEFTANEKKAGVNYSVHSLQILR